MPAFLSLEAGCSSADVPSSQKGLMRPAWGHAGNSVDSSGAQLAWSAWANQLPDLWRNLQLCCDAHLYYVNEVLALLGAGDSTELGPALFLDTISAL